MIEQSIFVPNPIAIYLVFGRLTTRMHTQPTVADAMCDHYLIITHTYIPYNNSIVNGEAVIWQSSNVPIFDLHLLPKNGAERKFL